MLNKKDEKRIMELINEITTRTNIYSEDKEKEQKMMKAFLDYIFTTMHEHMKESEEARMVAQANTLDDFKFYYKDISYDYLFKVMEEQRAVVGYLKNNLDQYEYLTNLYAKKDAEKTIKQYLENNPEKVIEIMMTGKFE